jgi:hypothetical protein
LQKTFIYICIITLIYSCAQITPLTGGKKDDMAPKAVHYFPENFSIDFTSTSIEIVFDEYIVLKDIANQFIITPQTTESPNIQVNGKKLKISFTETLLPNTTYKLAFGNAISDINEFNILENFEYVFSTGSTIDSLTVMGSVRNSLNQKSLSNILIALYDSKAEDSIVYHTKPSYITKTNLDGIFKFNYLPANTFKAIAIKDNNKNLLYDGIDEEIGFLENTINTKDTSKRNFLLFKEIASKNFIKKTYSTDYGNATIVYNKPQDNIISVNAKGLIKYQQTKYKDSLILYYNNKYDTLNAIINRNNILDTVSIKIQSEDQVKKELSKQSSLIKMSTNFTNTMHYYVQPVIQFNRLIKSEKVDATKITLTQQEDSITSSIPITIIKKNGFIENLKIDANILPETNYTLTINKGAVNDFNDNNNDSIAYTFKTTSKEDYATLNMKLYFPQKENYIVLLLNDKEQVINETQIELSLTSTSEKNLKYENLIPGNYFLKIIADTNKNGLFDTGDYLNKKQPETIFVNLSPIKLIAGWEIENEWIVK